MAYYASKRKSRGVLMTAMELLHGVQDQEDFDSQYASHANDLNQQQRREEHKVYTQKDNNLKLWKRTPTERDTPGKKYPNYSGKGMVHGQECKAALWYNKTKAGKDQLNVELTFNDGTTTTVSQTTTVEDPDSIPF